MSSCTRLLLTYLTCLGLAISVSASTDSLPPTSSSVPVKFLGTLNLPNPVFASIAFQDDPSLLVTSLGASGQGTVYTISDISDLSSSSRLGSKKANPVPGKINWANDATEAPEQLFGSRGIAVGGGALLSASSNTDDGIYYSAVANGTAQHWTRFVAKSGWFYHHVIFADLSGSGVPQIVCCRTTKHAGGQSVLVRLMPEDNSQPLGPWQEIELSDGCNAAAVADLNGDGHPEIVTVSSNALTIVSSLSQWRYSGNVTSATVDRSLIGASDIQIVDMNGDGKPDLLVSDQSSGGSVFAYENPGYINPSAFTRHSVASGFPAAQQTQSSTRLGSLMPFDSSGASGSPYIALAGGAAQAAYVLVPRDVFQYDITLLHRCHCTVGKLAVADVNRDGKQEIIVPCTGRNNVAAYSIEA